MIVIGGQCDNLRCEYGGQRPGIGVRLDRQYSPDRDEPGRGGGHGTAGLGEHRDID